MIEDIHPRSPIERLRRDYSAEQLERPIDTATAVAVVGMTYNFAVRATGYPSGARPQSLTLTQVIDLLDLDGYQETFVPRSKVPDYLLEHAKAKEELSELPKSAREPLPVPVDPMSPSLVTGHAGHLLRRLPSRSVQCVVTSSPYWGMRIYDTLRKIKWADGELCPYGFEQTPEGFIRHTVEILHVLRPTLTATASVWWNLMDTYNTRTPIRGTSKEKLNAMGGHPDHSLGWTEHDACRHSAGHLYLTDGELASIPSRVAERASRIGYRLKSFVTWNKDSTPEPVKSRVTRQSEYVLHLSNGPTPYFNKSVWKSLERRLGGFNEHESSKKVTDVWCIPTSNGSSGHGAEFPVALPARCIALSSKEDDLVVDPFVGSGTSAIAAMELRRRFIGFDVSKAYIEQATVRISAVKMRIESTPRLPVPTIDDDAPAVAVNEQIVPDLPVPEVFSNPDLS